jgi:type VI secretion system secreted protein VgrG
MKLDPLTLLGELFGSDTRLYELDAGAAFTGLHVEAWSLREALNQTWRMDLTCLSLDAHRDLDAMLGQHLTLNTRLADGSRHPRSGVVMNAAAEEADGGLARYRLHVAPWLALLAHTRRSQVWQDKTLVQIVESIFSSYKQHAAWAWADDCADHLAQSAFSDPNGQRSYTVQYRETDLAFVQRLLAEEGLNYRFEAHADAPAQHHVVIFAHSPSQASCPPDAVSAGGNGIRFHRAGSQEQQDAIQAFGGQRRLTAATSSALSWDYKGKRSVATSVPTAAAFGGANAPRLEDYEPAGAYAWRSRVQAERALLIAQQRLEARHKAWLGRATVRSFSPGLSFTLTGSTLDALDSLSSATASGKASGSGKSSDRGSDREGATDKRFILTAVTHAGINNLPKEMNATIGSGDLLSAWVDAEVRAQAQASGYGNAFEASRAAIPWRPEHRARPIADGMQTATVVGPDGGQAGQAQASGGDEIHTDRLGRIRIRHHFQQAAQAETRSPDTSNSSTWVRVLQRWAGAGMGLHFTPRIGQEVLIDYIEGDIDRPLVIGALYNGRGEAGTAPTPGGQPAESDTSAFAQSTDHHPSAQGNLSAGNAPPWHGASAAALSAQGQANAAALSGWKSKEFGADGFNQLVFDDSNQQLRLQLATTQSASQLNLGHLIHQADNHRGSFRGLGFELRTDAYGAVRAKQGLLISTYGTAASEPAGDNTAGIALAQQLKTLGQTFSQAAGTHQTVQLASHIGSFKANTSAVSDKEAPLQALHTVLKGMVASTGTEQAQSDAAAKHTGTGKDKLPHSTDPIIAIAAKAGLGMVAGQDIQLSAGETVTMASGQDTHIGSGGASRIHTGQAIGMLAGAIQAGNEAAGKGLTLIAGKGDIEVQAQADTMQIAAKKDLTIQSANAHIDWASPKKIVMATAAGANITIEGGNITVMCPGKITIKAGKKSFIGPERVNYAAPTFPSSELIPMIRFGLQSHGGGSVGHAYAHEPYQLFADGGLIQKGIADENGAISFKHKIGVGQYRVELVNGQVFDIDVLTTFGSGEQRATQLLANAGYRDEPSARSSDPGRFKGEGSQRASVKLTESGVSAHKGGDV